MTIRDNLQTIGERIQQAEQSFNRPLGSVQLLAVSKKQPLNAIVEAYTAGQRLFGENYAQEMAEKAQNLKHLAIEWHFIGPIQSNKTKLIAQNAAWVHSVDNLKIAQRLNEQVPADKAPLNVCIQVNISHEASKSGLSANETLALAQQIVALPNLRLRGLMAIPAPEVNFVQQRAVFAQLRQLLQQLNQQGFNLDTLSMGMSDDMQAAIAEGATIVRIGTAIFGTRQ
jgi:hypothetical protein